MNEEELQRFNEFINEKWPEDKRECEVCKNKEWIIQNELVCMLPLINGKVKIPGNTCPFILMLCSSCYNSKLFPSAPLNLGGSNE